MSSSTLIGDRRWASSRKGMTVLGKVPKPINLPSQRLENNGLDPNVEIVPKGTLTWGNRPSATPNAWGSLAHSPSSTDGSIGSPSHHIGRPSSGGNGTRPSTAGSDQCSESATSAWGSCSRPSSASGIMAPNQAPLASARPRSAETRPGSSQLSRFAEPIPENSVAWSSGTAGHLGPPSRTSDFMLSSGDFPILGSGKKSDMHGQQDSHGLQSPTPNSDLTPTEKEEFHSPIAGAASGGRTVQDTFKSWKVDTSVYTSASPPRNPNWHLDLQSNQPPSSSSSNMKVNHYNWCGPPRSPPDGMWYGGMPTGACGPGLRPVGNYMSDSFSCYSSQPVVMPNATPSPAILGGYPRKNDESLRPQLTSDSYIIPTVPIISIKPGTYASSVPCDSYYGPQNASFSNLNERERPFVGIASCPGIYNQFSNQNTLQDLEKHGTCSSSGAPSGKEHVERFHSQESHGEKYRVLLKNRDGVVHRDNIENLDGASLQTSSKKIGKEEPAAGCRGSVLDGVYSIAPKSGSVDQGRMALSKDRPGTNKSQTGGIVQVHHTESVISSSDVQQSMNKSALIEKIEGLNNKIRVTELRTMPIVASKEEKMRRVKSENFKNTVQSSSVTMHADNECTQKKRSSGYGGDIKVVNQQSAITTTGVPDSTRTNPSIPNEHDQLSINMTQKLDKGSKIDHPGILAVNNFGMQGEAHFSKVTEENVHLDPLGRNSQRVKSKEAELQKAKKPQKEEWSKEQQEKLLVKLDEFDSCALESSSIRKVDCTSTGSNLPLHKQVQVAVSVNKNDVTGTDLVQISCKNDSSLAAGGVAEQNNKKLPSAVVQTQVSPRRLENAMVTRKDISMNRQISFGTVQTHDSDRNTSEGFALVQTCNSNLDKSKGESTASQTCEYVPGNLISQDSPCRSEIKNNLSSHISNNQGTDNLSKQRHSGHRRRNVSQHEKNAVEVLPAAPVADLPWAPDIDSESCAADNGSVQTPVESTGSLTQHRKKINRITKPRNKSQQGISVSMPGSQVQSGAMLEKHPQSCKIGELPIESAISCPVQIVEESGGMLDKGDSVQSYSGWSPSVEDGQTKTSQWKPQSFGRMIRSGQSRSSDKLRGSDSVVWAPVRPSSKGEHGEQIAKKDPSSKTGTDFQNLKYKRAEMERYVPKLAMKDTSQHRSSQKTESAIDASAEATNNEPVESNTCLDEWLSTASKSEDAIENIVNIGHSNKHAQIHSSWRQRGSKGFPDATKSGTKYLDQDLMPKFGSSPNRSLSLLSEGNDSCGSTSFHTDESVMMVAKDQGAVTRGKNQMHRGGKLLEVDLNATDGKVSKNVSVNKPKLHDTSGGADPSDARNSIASENSSQVERTRSHWKPKSTQSCLPQRQDIVHTEKSKCYNLIEEPSREARNPVVNDVESKRALHSGTASVETDNHLQGSRKKERNRVVSSFDGPSDVSGRDSSLVEHDAVRTDGKSGTHGDMQSQKNQESSYCLQYHKAHERYFGHDTGCRNLAGNGNRRHPSHYEYQRVEPHRNALVENNVQHGNSRAAGPSYREHGHQRRGGQFYARSSGPVQGGEIHSSQG